MNTLTAAAILLQPVPLIAGWVFYLAGMPIVGLILLGVGSVAALVTSVAAWVAIVHQVRTARRDQAEVEEFQRRIENALDRMQKAVEDV